MTTSLNAQVKVLALAGSSASGSLNKKLVLEAANMARDMGASVEYVDLKVYPIPIYDADDEQMSGMPENAKRLRNLMVDSNVIIIASPEYNGSLSALLKNVIDWVSRAEDGTPSRSAFKGKKFVIISASPGSLGGARGLVHLRAILSQLGGTVMTDQVVVPEAHNAFDEGGRLKNQTLRSDLKNLVKQSIN